ncbi:hypothetical protein NP493_309g02093 [Ridgeia piscesae]|uniref:RIIa domain-containing protein n=1 Tax=Ridgeia piscesae TaxID=27915 RepID=A0AAD9NV35_RIDPI|nr:hypothetical protein NP493_309g02093 [Ridgeia piscesae]
MSKYVDCEVHLPPGMTRLLLDFTAAVIRMKPTDLSEFAAYYFSDMYQIKCTNEEKKAKAKGIRYSVAIMGVAHDHQLKQLKA